MSLVINSQSQQLYVQYCLSLVYSSSARFTFVRALGQAEIQGPSVKIEAHIMAFWVQNHCLNLFNIMKMIGPIVYQIKM